MSLPRLAQLLGVDPTGVAGRVGGTIRNLLGADPTGLGRMPYGDQFYNPTNAMTLGLQQQMAQGPTPVAPPPNATPMQAAAARAGLQGPPPPAPANPQAPSADNPVAVTNTAGRRGSAPATTTSDGAPPLGLGIASPAAIRAARQTMTGTGGAPPVAMGLGGLFGGANPTVSATNPNIDLRNGTATQRMPGQPMPIPANGGWTPTLRDARQEIRSLRDEGWRPFGHGLMNGLNLTQTTDPTQWAAASSKIQQLGQPTPPDQLRPPVAPQGSVPPQSAPPAAPGVDMGIRSRAKQTAMGAMDLGAQIRQQVQNSLAQSGININLMGGAPPITSPTAVGKTRHQRVAPDQTQQPPIPQDTAPTGSVDQQAKLDKSVAGHPALGDPSDDRWGSVNQWDGDIVNQANQAWQDAINAGEIAPGTPVDPALYSIMKAHIQIESQGDPNATQRDAQGNPLAYGLGQLTPNAVHANEIPWNDVYDPNTNLYWVGRELISRYADPNNPNGWVGASMGYFSGSYELNGRTDQTNGTTDSDYYNMMQRNLSEIEAAAPANQTPVNRQAKQIHDINDLGADTTVPIDQTVNTHNTKANALLDYARQFVGYAYQEGATRDLSQTPSSFDCSSFVRWVYYHTTGKTLGPTTYQQINEGTPVSWDHMKPGDLVFFDTYTGDGPVGQPGSTPGDWGSDTTPDTAEHVGIYLGNGKMINAMNPADGVKIVDMNTPYWEQSFVGARRLDW